MSTPMFYPPAVFRPVRNTSGWMVEPTRGLIPHVQVGRGSLLGWFDNPASEVSAHLWLSYGGEFEQYVPFNRRAWAQAAGNPYWISVECEGFDTEDYTAIQVQRLAELYAWGMAEFGWPAQITDDPNGRGIGTHRMGGRAWGLHSCPGPIRAGRRGDILAAALAIGAVQALKEEDDMPSAAEIVDEFERRALAGMARAEAPHAVPPLALKVGPEGGVWEILARTYFKAGDLQSRAGRIEAGLSAAAPAAAHAMAAPGPALQLGDLLDAVTRLDPLDAARLAEAAAGHAASLLDPGPNHTQE